MVRRTRTAGEGARRQTEMVIFRGADLVAVLTEQDPLSRLFMRLSRLSAHQLRSVRDAMSPRVLVAPSASAIIDAMIEYRAVEGTDVKGAAVAARGG